MEEAWYQSLADLNDELGRAAFAACMRLTNFGDIEPGHILEQADKLKAERIMQATDNPWITDAPKFQGIWGSDAHRAWKSIESKKLYRSKHTLTGEIFLIQNPEAWGSTQNADGSWTHCRLKPIATGEFIKTQKEKHYER